MHDLELIFSMLGEVSTTTIVRSKDAKGFIENKETAKEGGTVARVARTELERRSKKKVSTTENYLDEPEFSKRRKLN